MNDTGNRDDIPPPDPHRSGTDFFSSTGQLEESWRANARPWTEAVRSGAIESRRLATDRAITDAVLERDPQRVLDLGCGEGWLGRALTGHGIEVVGIDASEPLIEAARLAGHGGDFQVVSYSELIADPRRIGRDFQVITANFALLEHCVIPLLQALRQLLAPAGALIIQTLHPWNAGAPYRDGWRTENFHGFATADWQPMPWYFRTLGSWLQSLREAGYQLEALREPVHPSRDTPLSLLLIASTGQISHS